MTNFLLLVLTYSMLLTTIFFIHKNQIMKHIKKSIKQYIEYMDSVPLEYSVGK